MEAVVVTARTNIMSTIVMETIVNSVALLLMVVAVVIVQLDTTDTVMVESASGAGQHPMVVVAATAQQKITNDKHLEHKGAARLKCGFPKNPHPYYDR
jgi:hypothetical protein